MSELSFALAVDLFTVVCSAALLARMGRLGHSHPATIYLVFHVLVVTQRLVGLLAGAPTLFSGFGSRFEGVGEDELVRAALVADLGLVAFTIGAIKAGRDDLFGGALRAARGPVAAAPRRMLDTRKVWWVVALAVPLGVLFLLNFAAVPGLGPFVRADTREWSGSSWALLPRTWPGLGLLALIYVYGFVPWLVLPMGAYLLLMVYQGMHRFRVVLPLLLMVQIYLDRRGRRWPTAGMAAVLLSAVLLFYPLKTIGKMMQQGATPSEIAAHSQEIVGEVLAGRTGDQTILDQLASGLTLSDRSGAYYFGHTFLAVATLPVPRPLWHEKPGLADHIAEISTEQRPMAKWGMVLTYLGEAYVNFGTLGTLLIPALLGYGLARFYFVAYRAPYLSVLRLAYLLTACNLIQVYRDGLVSLLVFTLVHMMPLVLLLALHARRARVLVRREWRPAVPARPA